MTKRKIVGVCLLRNEQYFAAWALMNAVAFCDRIIVMDNRSQDRTRRVVEAVAAKHRHVEIIDVQDPWGTHRYIEGLAGTPTWVFAVDGDEIYDPIGLKRLRAALLAGAYDRHWRLVGHSVHALSVDLEAGRALGYSQPAAGSVCKLYNFQIIDSWPSRQERLHGGEITFKRGFIETDFRIWELRAWAESDMRMLHLCFFPRSPQDRRDLQYGRDNPVMAFKQRTLWLRLQRRAKLFWGAQIPTYHDHRQRRLAQGAVREFDISGFGTPADFREFDAGCDEAMGVLAGGAPIAGR